MKSNDIKSCKQIVKDRNFNKAFTLIELLAVIVILAVIAVIATPIILGVIDDAKKSSYVNSASGILDSATKFIMSKELLGEVENHYQIDLTGDTLTYSGQKPTSGTLLIDSLQNMSIVVNYEDFCIEKKFEEEEPTIKDKAECIVEASEVTSSMMYKERTLNGADPVISGDLIPVTINSVGEVRKSSVNDNYYSYKDKVWANAIIATSEAKGAVNTLNVGDVILENQIESYFVWIPRYRYQLWRTGNTGTYGVDNPEHSIKIEFENKNTTPSTGTNNGEWLTHPAFTSFGTNGMWVGKFETGYEGATSIDTAEVNSNDSTKVIVKPNVYSWRGIQVANAFLTSYNYKRELDSHMMKNTEWGAVAYLSHSAYGIDGSIRLNNNSALLTGYAAVDEPTCGYTDLMSTCNAYGTTEEFTKPYNTGIGYMASTTGNISGIYDMSGGSWEYVMGALFDGNTLYSGRHNIYNSGFYGALGCTTGTCGNGVTGYNTNIKTVSSTTTSTSIQGITDLMTYNTKYYDKYTVSNLNTGRILGDATSEMGPFGTYSYTGVAYSDGVTPTSGSYQTSSWNKGGIAFIYYSNSWFVRGDNYNEGLTAGAFYFGISNGRINGTGSFRLVFAPSA